MWIDMKKVKQCILHCMEDKILVIMLKKMFKPFIAIILQFFYFWKYPKCKRSKNIFCECYLQQKNENLTVQNWGDDLNVYFIEEVTGKKVINIPYTKMHNFGFENVYSLIGSIIGFYNLNGKIIYGSGIQNPDNAIVGIPQKIISVRGPKTRDVLCKQGIDCPICYGDPALLLPVFYEPTKNKSEQGCLILNMGSTDVDENLLENIRTSLNLKIVSMTSYNKWQDIIDEIVNSSFVISESLHGLIVSETYGVPNVWVEFKDHPAYWNFKFEDYYESIGKTEQIVRLQNEFNIEMLKDKIDTWHKGNIDYNELLSYFPFDVKSPINQSLLSCEQKEK